MPQYKGYSIAIVEQAPLRWFATIQRLDGKRMKSPTTGATVTIWECPDPADTAEAAIEEAKAVIDAAGLNFTSEDEPS
jgi:hypothetical protein